ncbi:hypothetical protein [Streptomyces mirabilis]|uniref:hypothetical protein n=1 Tax=Streptomyces mirabilis TaxID=68239 RepID=UPI0036C23E7A
MSTDVSGMIECRPGARLSGPDDEDSVRDASEALRTEYAAYDGSADVHGTTQITWAEPASTDWQVADSSGTRSRDMVAGDRTRWGPVRGVMRTLGELHRADNVRLVVWFH